MASSLGILIQQLLTSANGNGGSASASSYHVILGTLFGAFYILSAFPVVFKDYIQCLCDPENIWKDTLETVCLMGNLKSNVSVGNTTFIVTHDHYQYIPNFFLLLMFINILPTISFNCLESGTYSALVSGMHSYNPREDKSRSVRIHWFFERELSHIARHYLYTMINDLAGACLLVYEVWLCDSKMKNVLQTILTSVINGDNFHQQFFPQEIHCVVEKWAPDGHKDIEEFRCFLPMNLLYLHMFEIAFGVFVLSALLAVAKTGIHLLVLSSAYRR